MKTNPVPSTYSSFGRKFNTLTFTTVDETNQYMTDNEDYGLIYADDENSIYHVAKMKDKGVKI